MSRQVAVAAAAHHEQGLEQVPEEAGIRLDGLRRNEGVPPRLMRLIYEGCIQDAMLWWS